MSERQLEDYLTRPMSPPATEVLREIEDGPVDPSEDLSLDAVERLLDPAPMARETGWSRLPDGVAHVAVRTAMPGVSAEMVDWWFDWHPREAIRYRIWHPAAHRGNSLELPAERREKAHWGAVHHPVEDLGMGVIHARIAFRAPSEMGFSSDALDLPEVATIVCGEAGDDRLRVRHTPMFHVFLGDGDGVTLRSHFWLGAALRPYGPLGSAGALLLNRPAVRRRALPGKLPQALARHCAEEYANLAALLPELHARFGPAAEG